MSSSGRRPPGLPLGTENADRELWLWKIPTFVSDAWTAARPGAELGRVMLKVHPRGLTPCPPVVSVFMSPEARAPEVALAGPTDYEVHLTEAPPTQIFSEVMRKRRRDEDGEGGAISAAIFGGGAITMGTVTAEGLVALKGDMRPLKVEQRYRDLVRARMEGSLDRNTVRAMGATESQRLGHKANKTPGAPSLPPTSILASSRARARAEVKKVGVDTDLEALEASLFLAYDEKELWSLKELSFRLQKPANLVRSALEKIASQWREGADAGWRLRPEYRASNIEQPHIQP